MHVGGDGDGLGSDDGYSDSDEYDSEGDSDGDGDEPYAPAGAHPLAPPPELQR